MTNLEEFIEDARELAQDAEEGRRVKEAAQKGHVKTEMYHRDPAPGQDGDLRQMIAQVVIGVWNKEKRAVRLAEIYQGVREKIQQRIEDHDWPNVWGFPIRRTVDRRVNECADWRFYESESGVTPIISTRPGWYLANPSLFEKAVKEEILR